MVDPSDNGQFQRKRQTETPATLPTLEILEILLRVFPYPSTQDNKPGPATNLRIWYYQRREHADIRISPAWIRFIRSVWKFWDRGNGIREQVSWNNEYFAYFEWQF